MSWKKRRWWLHYDEVKAKTAQATLMGQYTEFGML